MSDAITITMSRPIPNDDWLHFYQESQFTSSASISDATTVTTTAAPAQLSPEGRVSKPTRRRSRGLRRTPTTLLNTDTTNFRAMVQQFTGGPSVPDLFGPSLPVPVNPNGLMFAPSQSLEPQHLYHEHYTTYPEGEAQVGYRGFFQRLMNPTARASDNGDEGRFFPTTTSS